MKTGIIKEIEELEKYKVESENKYGSKVHDGRTIEGRFYKRVMEMLKWMKSRSEGVDL